MATTEENELNFVSKNIKIWCIYFCIFVQVLYKKVATAIGEI